MSKTAFGVFGMAMTMATIAFGQDGPGTQSPVTCYSVIEAKTDVPPSAPILVNACTGETFILTRVGRGDRRSYVWRPIAKGDAGTPSGANASTAANRAAPPAARAGCFTFNGRTFCP